MTKWAEYHGSNIEFLQNKGPAYIDELRFVPILEAGNRAIEIESGNVDAVTNPGGQDVERLTANPDLVVVEFPQPANVILSLNHTRHRAWASTIFASARRSPMRSTARASPRPSTSAMRSPPTDRSRPTGSGTSPASRRSTQFDPELVEDPPRRSRLDRRFRRHSGEGRRQALLDECQLRQSAVQPADHGDHLREPARDRRRDGQREPRAGRLRGGSSRRTRLLESGVALVLAAGRADHLRPNSCPTPSTTATTRISSRPSTTGRSPPPKRS